MSEKDKSPAADPDPALEWAKLWQTMAESSNRMVEAWSGSMAPFMLARLSEKPASFGDGNELSAAIERMAQGPRLGISPSPCGASYKTPVPRNQVRGAAVSSPAAHKQDLERSSLTVFVPIAALPGWV